MGHTCKKLTSDSNVRKLLTKYNDYLDKTLDKTLDKSIDTSIVKEVKDDYLSKYAFLRVLNYLPPNPYKVKGSVESIGALMLYFNMRYIEIDPSLGTINRFHTSEDYPHNPLYVK